MNLLQASRYWPRMQVDGRVRLGPTFLEYGVHRFYRGKESCRVRLQFRLEHGVMMSYIQMGQWEGREYVSTVLPEEYQRNLG